MVCSVQATAHSEYSRPLIGSRDFKASTLPGRVTSSEMSPLPGDADSVPRLSSAATISGAAGSSDPKKPNRAKGNEFTFKHGKRHHSYDVDKAPYPLAYDADNLDM